MRRMGKFQIFAERELREYLERCGAELRGHLLAEVPEYLLGVKEDDYISHLISTFEVEGLAIDLTNTEVDSREEMIPAELFPSSFDTRRGGGYRKSVITYHIPFSGNPELLSLAPSSRLI